MRGAVTVGRYRGYPYQRSPSRYVFPHDKENPVLWFAFTPDRSDVVGWYDTRREMERDLDRLAARTLTPSTTEDDDA
jgi:hypothetical protein